MVIAMLGAGGKTYSNLKLSLLLLLPGARLGLNEGSVLCKLDHPVGVSPRPCRKIIADEQEEAGDAYFAVALASILLKVVTDAALFL
jgi:hypothetical protein